MLTLQPGLALGPVFSGRSLFPPWTRWPLLTTLTGRALRPGLALGPVFSGRSLFSPWTRWPLLTTLTGWALRPKLALCTRWPLWPLRANDGVLLNYGYDI